MKHYIITRFASWMYEPDGMTKEILFSDEFLQIGIYQILK